jgi:hypothetical protein
MNCKILYTFRPEGIRYCFADDVAQPVNIGIDVPVCPGADVRVSPALRQELAARGSAVFMNKIIF